MASVLHCEVIDPGEAMCPTAGGFGLLGIGSGIYYGRFHHAIRSWVRRLPTGIGAGHRVFIFSTSGLPLLSVCYHAPLRRSLQEKGFEVVGEFACRGHDTFAFLKFIGGLNRKHPDAADLKRAQDFACRL